MRTNWYNPLVPAPSAVNVTSLFSQMSVVEAVRVIGGNSITVKLSAALVPKHPVVATPSALILYEPGARPDKVVLLSTVVTGTNPPPRPSSRKNW